MNSPSVLPGTSLTASRMMAAEQLLPSRATVLHLRLPTDQRCSTAPQAGGQGAALLRLAGRWWALLPGQEKGHERGPQFHPSSSAPGTAGTISAAFPVLGLTLKTSGIKPRPSSSFPFGLEIEPQAALPPSYIPSPFHFFVLRQSLTKLLTGLKFVILLLWPPKSLGL